MMILFSNFYFLVNWFWGFFCTSCRFQKLRNFPFFFKKRTFVYTCHYFMEMEFNHFNVLQDHIKVILEVPG